MGVLIWKKMKRGVLIWKKLRVVSPFSGWHSHLGSMCIWLALIWNEIMWFFQQQLLKYWEIWYAYFLCFKTKKIVCILVISVMSNIFKCYQYRYSCPYFSVLTLQDIEDFNMYMIFLFFESFKISSNVRNPITPAMACLWIPMLTLHIHSRHLRLY